MSVVNKKQLADILGKSERTVTTWQKNGLPIQVDGTRGTENLYETAEVIAWMVQREINARIEERGGDATEFYDLEAERGRLTHHQANKTELEERVLRGRLIPSETVEIVWCDIIANFRAKVLSIPTKAAHEFTGLQDLNAAQNLLREHLSEALQELSEYDPQQYGIPDHRESAGDGSAATVAEGERMGRH